MRFPSALDPIRSLTASWKLITRAPGPLIVGGLILALTDDGLHGGGQVGDFDLSREQWQAALPVFVGCVCFAGLAFFLLSTWLWIGLPRAVDETRATGNTSFTTVFDSRGRYFDMLLARLLVLALSLAAALPFALIALAAYVLDERGIVEETAVVVGAFACGLVYLPVFVYVSLGFSWVVQAVAIEERAPIEALRRSWQLASGCRVALFVFTLVLLVFTFIGFCACCIGVLFTGAWAHIARCEAFLELTREDARPIAPSRVSYASGPVDTAPPALPYGAPLNPPPVPPEPPSWPPPPAS